MIGTRKVLAVGIVLIAVVGVACGTTAAAPTVTTAPTPTPNVTPRDVYLVVFNDVSVRLVDITRLMNQVSTFIGSDPALRSDFADTTDLILEDLNVQLGRLVAVEPVSDELTEVNDLLKMAIEMYIEAASLFVSGEQGEIPLFDFLKFQELMQNGGHDYHRAGELTALGQ